MSQPHHLDTEQASDEEEGHLPEYMAEDFVQHLMEENLHLRARDRRWKYLLEENVDLRARVKQLESEQHHEKEEENTREQASVPSKKRKIRDSDVSAPDAATPDAETSDAATSEVVTLDTMLAGITEEECAKTFLELIGDCHYSEHENEADDNEDAMTNQNDTNYINDAKHIIERFKNWTATHRKYSDAIELFHQHLERLIIHEAEGNGKFEQTRYLSLLLSHCDQRCEDQFMRVMDVHVEMGAWTVQRHKREWLAMYGVPL